VGLNEDPVNPSHYKGGAVECIEAIKAALTPEAFKGFCTGNAIKYMWRWEKKGGVTDIEKAQWYLNQLLSAAKGSK
jgi:hypothetical protein